MKSNDVSRGLRTMTLILLAAIGAWFFKVWNERDWKMMGYREQKRQSDALERIAGVLEKNNAHLKSIAK